MGLLDLIAAYAIAQGSHTGGHFRQANNPENPMRDTKISFIPRKLAEDWENWDTKDDYKKPNEKDKYKELVLSKEEYIKDKKKKDVDIQGAGFATQDKMLSMMEGHGRENISKMNALIKLLFLSGVTNKISDTGIAKGDIKEMQHMSGNKYVPHMVGLTALSDLLQKKDSRTSLGFRVENGQPGLVINHRF